MAFFKIQQTEDKIIIKKVNWNFYLFMGAIIGLLAGIVYSSGYNIVYVVVIVAVFFIALACWIMFDNNSNK